MVGTVDVHNMADAQKSANKGQRVRAAKSNRTITVSRVNRLRIRASRAVLLRRAMGSGSR
jgi:hypothetical protein